MLAGSTLSFPQCQTFALGARATRIAPITFSSTFSILYSRRLAAEFRDAPFRSRQSRSLALRYNVIDSRTNNQNDNKYPRMCLCIKVYQVLSPCEPRLRLTRRLSLSANLLFLLSQPSPALRLAAIAEHLGSLVFLSPTRRPARDRRIRQRARHGRGDFVCYRTTDEIALNRGHKTTSLAALHPLVDFAVANGCTGFPSSTYNNKTNSFPFFFFFPHYFSVSSFFFQFLLLFFFRRFFLSSTAAVVRGVAIFFLSLLSSTARPIKISPIKISGSSVPENNRRRS